MGNFISNYANIPNPITKFFNKIDYVRLCEDYSKMIWCLEAMKKVPLYVKKISIPSNYEEELEILTDPNLHNTPISNLELKLLDSFCFSSKTIENLKAIYPNLITLEADDSDLFCNDETLYQALFQNFTKLLSNLDQTSLQVDFEWYYFNFKLEFRDVIFKVVESKEEWSYIRATSVEIRCKYEELCWIK